ncbi:MAG: hypothetical protein ACHQ50_15905 [Fimbriimonadales bacterium]
MTPYDLRKAAAKFGTRLPDRPTPAETLLVQVAVIMEAEKALHDAVERVADSVDLQLATWQDITTAALYETIQRTDLIAIARPPA